MALTEKDLAKIYNMVEGLLDIKLDQKLDERLDPKLNAFSNRLANLEDDVMKIFGVLNTELPIISQHLRDHADLLDEHKKRLDEVDIVLKEFGRRLGQRNYQY